MGKRRAVLLDQLLQSGHQRSNLGLSTRVVENGNTETGKTGLQGHGWWYAPCAKRGPLDMAIQSHPLLTQGLIAEYEFYQFRAPSTSTGSERNTSSTATFLKENPVSSLPPLTEGMFGYSLTRPVHNQGYYYGVFNSCHDFKCDIESWHTESGPGVYEAVSAHRPIVSSCGA